ncbi:MAG: hypothetical protein MIO93_08190, partial [ANME-2 cluster archaeon]|nr:hypothetical protein [ANME-2 cluster archaeon]
KPSRPNSWRNRLKYLAWLECHLKITTKMNNKCRINSDFSNLKVAKSRLERFSAEYYVHVVELTEEDCEIMGLQIE